MARFEDDQRLPIKFGPVSNGEFYPRPHSAVVGETIRRTHDLATRNASRLGISRRRFLSGLSGAAATLFVLSACSKEESNANRGGDPGGTYDVSEEATIDPDVAFEELGGEEFIFDVQTHFLDFDLSVPPDEEPLGTAGLFRNRVESCEYDDPRACFTMEAYMDELFLRSDTTLAVISALPAMGENSQLPQEAMFQATLVAEELCRDERVLMHAGAYPHVGDTEAALDAMTQVSEEYPVAAWKIYTMIPPDAAFYFDDHDPDYPQVGQRFIDHVRELGPPIICTHKGIGALVGNQFELSSPKDIGPAAAANRDISFVVYHSGFEFTREPEGPYDEATADVSINRLIASMEAAGIGPDENVYAELGSTWGAVMRDPDAAAHTLGKLLSHVGEDNVVWGTDSIWTGTPQDQIQALRTFEISEEYQERFGYPALTPEIKAKIFGLNSARLYGVEPETVPCPFTREDLEGVRAELSVGRTYGPETMAEAARIMEAHRMLLT